MYPGKPIERFIVGFFAIAAGLGMLIWILEMPSRYRVIGILLLGASLFIGSTISSLSPHQTQVRRHRQRSKADILVAFVVLLIFASLQLWILRLVYFRAKNRKSEVSQAPVMTGERRGADVTHVQGQ